uniref:Angiotensin-converting enzyme n=1 Tax=Rhabditophanes sp. KR3021 TaxID=114890 RepID=A0AC35U5K0_9BILA
MGIKFNLILVCILLAFASFLIAQDANATIPSTTKEEVTSEIMKESTISLSETTTPPTPEGKTLGEEGIDDDDDVVSKNTTDIAVEAPMTITKNKETGETKDPFEVPKEPFTSPEPSNVQVTDKITESLIEKETTQEIEKAITTSGDITSEQTTVATTVEVTEKESTIEKVDAVKKDIVPEHFHAHKINRVNFDDLSVEDYHDVVEQTKPDTIDDAAIDQLVDKFLNTGSIGNDPNKPREHINKKAYELVNTSKYWSTEDIKEPSSIKSEEEAAAWLKGYNKEGKKVLKEVSISTWEYFTSVTPRTKVALTEAEEVLGMFLSSSSKQAKQFDVKSFGDASIIKQLRLITVDGIQALGEEKLAEHDTCLSEINKIFVNTDICEDKKQTKCMYKITDLSTVIPSEADVSKLRNYWASFRQRASKETKGNYTKLVGILNESAKAGGYENTAALWNSPFDLSNRDTKPEFDLMNEIQGVQGKAMPLYKEIHAYVRHYLPAIYPNETSITRDGPIPAHLLKSYNGDDWSTMYEETKPLDEMEDIEIDVMSGLHSKNMSVKGMFTSAYRYFKFLGFSKAPKSLWTKSIFSKVWSNNMICNPSTSMDMNDNVDYRIKTCEVVGLKGFKEAHKLIADMYYQYVSKVQPLLLRDSPNPSFKSALSNAISIAAGNVDYLKSLGLLSAEFTISENAKINGLYKEAVEQFVKLPTYLIADLWRQDLFKGKLPETEWNKHWWMLKNNLQGLKSPLEDDTKDNDLLVNTFVTQKHSPAIRHHISYVMQFQILRAFCPNVPAAKLYNGCVLEKDIMSKIEIIMKEGASIDYLTALEMITGDRKLDSTPMLEYFSPLFEWLKKYNKDKKLFVGWDGKGEAFNPDEVPKIGSVQSGVNNNEFNNGGAIAFPGQDCTKGQDCLLESTCNGTICACNAGLYTLVVADTYSCVPGDPNKAGFGDGKGGLIIGIFNRSGVETTLQDATTTTPVQPTTVVTPKKTNEGSVAKYCFSLMSFAIIASIFWA